MVPKTFEALRAIVALGGSAGSLAALIEFLDHLPESPTGCAFIFVQHLSPDHGSHLADVLRPHSSRPVVHADAGVVLNPDHIYVNRPGQLPRLNGTTFYLEPRDATAGGSKTIDEFFASVAEQKVAQPFGILLSGCGADGASGLRRIKDEGGATLIEAPAHAQFDSMPLAAYHSGAADFSLSPKDMPDKILTLMRNIELRDALPEGDAASEPSRADVLPILELIKNTTNDDFTLYKQSTVLRRIRRRMGLRQIESLAQYLAVLTTNASERLELVKDFLIGVTFFYRDPDVYAALEATVFPKLFTQKATANEPIRVWIIGCSTGEEAYSFAILLSEAKNRHKLANEIQIFASDIDARAIARARQGHYPPSIAANIPKDHLERYFTKTSTGYQIIKEIRDLCLFCNHDVTRDPPFGNLDLAACRNLLIYMEPPLQARVFGILAFALRPHGFLVLGPSEAPTSGTTQFRAIDLKGKIYENLGGRPAPLTFETAFPAAAALPRSRVLAPDLPRLDRPVVETYEKTLLQKWLPALVLVDDDNNVVYLSRRAQRFLHLPERSLTANLFQMAPEPLRLELRSLLNDGRKTQQPTRKTRVRITDGAGKQRYVNLDFEMIEKSVSTKQVCAIVIEESTDAADQASAAQVTPGVNSDVIGQLEGELHQTKRHLHDMIIEREDANERLRSVNEELLSTNEELQSTNEELQSSQEELQSVNEELETLNSTLNGKVEELDASNSDLLNLLKGIRIPALFLDNQLRIKRFTPEIGLIIRLRDTDIDRPITDFVVTLGGVDIRRESDAIRAELVTKDFEVRVTEANAWYIMRILPYQTMRNTIEGVVITFLDVTGLKEAQAEKAYLAAIVEHSDAAILTQDLDGIITSWNKGAEQIYGYSAQEAVGKSVDLILLPGRQDDVGMTYDRIRAGERFLRYDAKRHTKDGRLIIVSNTISPIFDNAAVLNGVSVIGWDVTLRRQAEVELARAKREADEANAAKNRFMAHMSHEVRTPLTAISGFADCILTGGNDTETILDYAMRIKTSASLLTHIVSDILDLSKIEAQKFDIVRAPASLKDIIDQIAAELARAAQAKGLALNFTWLTTTPAALQMDAHRVHQVLSNLIANAIKFTNLGRIDVSVRADRRADAASYQVVIEVADTGQGIATGKQAILFSPFTQIDSSMARRYGGSGLGLYLSSKFADAMGGKLSLKRSAPEQGSTFCFEFPAVPADAEPPKLIAAGQPATDEWLPRISEKLRGARILVAEDTVDNQVLLKALLTPTGCQVMVANDGSEALELLARQAFDLILMDLQMPLMDGYQTIRHLRAQGMTLPVIALTAHAMKGEQEQCLAAGFTAYLSKPVDRMRLLQCIFDWLP